MNEDSITEALRNPLEHTGTLLAAAKDQSTSPVSLMQMTLVLVPLLRSRTGKFAVSLRIDDSVFVDAMLIDIVLSEIASRRDAMPLTYERLGTFTNSPEIMKALSGNEAVPEQTRRASKRALWYLSVLRAQDDARHNRIDSWSTVYSMTPKHVRRLLSIG